MPSFQPDSRTLPPSKRADILRYLLLGWHPDDIATACGVAVRTVYTIQSNLMRYGSPTRPQLLKLGRPKRLTDADTKALLEWLLIEGWRLQDEIVYWLWNERGVIVSQSTVSRMLKRNKWSRKELRRISLNRSEPLQQAYREDIL